MKRMTSMARAALLSGLLLCIGSAVADERTRMIDVIMGKATFECSTEAFQLALQSADNKTANLIMHDVRLDLKLPEKWREDNPDYDKAYAMLLAAAADEARRSGPLMSGTSATAFLRSIMATMPSATLQEFSDFFMAPKVRLNVPYLIDVYACLQIQELISHSSADRAATEMTWRKMYAASQAQTRDWATNVEPMTQEERSGSGKAMDRFIVAIVEGIDATRDNPVRAARSAAIRRTHQAALKELAQPYMAAQ